MIKRNISLDVVRVFAVFSVISVHYFLNSGFYYTPVAGKRMLVMAMIRNFFMICVPLFIMLTGYLMSSKELDRRYYLGIKKTLFIYVLASVACIAFKRIYMHENYGMKESVLGILDFSAADYSWYIEMYIGLFLLIPFLNLIYQGLKSKKQKQLLLITLLMMTAVPEMFNIFNFYVESWWRYPILSGEYQQLLPDWWAGTIYPLLYYYVGCYYKEYRINMNKKISVLVLGSLVVAGGIFSYYRSYGDYFVWGTWNGYYSITVVFMTVLVFNIIAKIEIWNHLPDFAKRILKSLSNAALGAYLLSYIFDSMVYPYFANTVYEFNYRFEYYFIIVPVIFVCSMICSYGMNVIYSVLLRLRNVLKSCRK